MDETIIIGMSGGVDSAVAAAELIDKGYTVEGIFMKNWDESDSEFCTATEDHRDALQVCDILRIPLRTVDLSDEYWKKVFQLFLDECRSGRTPNPDILCNKEIKFRAFLNHAFELGAVSIATGHYAHIDRTNGLFQLYRGADPGKDQSYFLCTLNQDQLSKSIFPIGNWKKAKVRKKAYELGFNNHDKKDSTGICFIGERNYRQFLKRFLPIQSGQIITDEGKIIGEHDGLMYYTYGQRQGLGIGGGYGKKNAPWYVTDKDIDQNTLIVGQGHDHPELYHRFLTTSQAHWISGSEPIKEVLTAKIRYRTKDAICRLIEKNKNSLIVEFNEPQFAITPGQSIVFYDKEICLGGAVIETRTHSIN